MTPTEQLSLKYNQALAVDADQLLVESGVLWLTQSGSADDVLLLAGQSFRPRRSGKVVIQSLAEGTSVRLQSTSVFAYLRELVSWSLNACSSNFRFGVRHCGDKASGTIQ